MYGSYYIIIGILVKGGVYVLIGNQYADNKVYRGIRHYDSLPLTSGDLHEYSDTLYMKTAYIMNNIIGYGTLNTPNVTISTSGISLREPSVVLIDGDVSLIQSDDNTPIVSKESIRSAGYENGVLCIVGWYQQILARSTMRNYGGVDNSILPNDLLYLNDDLDVQVSTRYQFRWAPIILSTTDISGNSLTFELVDRTESGDKLSTSSTITSNSKFNNVFTAAKPSTMSYAVSDLYIVPIIKYHYDASSDNITDASASLPATPKGSSGFISSESEPLGEYVEGTTWYNPTTREFKTYVQGTGFVSSASTMGFLQYQSVYTMTETMSTPQNIPVPIDISELAESDILQVIYEGLTLVEGEHYSIDYDSHMMTLLNFTVTQGDKITFTAIKLVEANDITNITATFIQHMASTGSSTIEAHVKLSDSIESTSDSNSGVAATPKAVYESRFISDIATDTKYRLGIDNGVLYIEEV